MNNIVNIALTGNPNCGKTTLFNAYTGARLKAANRPGVTVEKKEGIFDFRGKSFNLVDLPGIYSLTSYTMEEKVSRRYILDSEADVILNIVDASALERSLYFTLQLIELGKPIVLALNMMDKAEKCGVRIDMRRLEDMLGIPVVAVSARKKSGLDNLINASGRAERADGLRYSDKTENRISLVKSMLEEKYGGIVNPRWHAVKILEGDGEIIEKYSLGLKKMDIKECETDIINQKYNYIEKIMRECVSYKNQKDSLTDRADKILTHPVLGLPVFMLIMGIVFALTFTLGDYLKGFLEMWFETLSAAAEYALTNMNADKVLISLTTDGIIAGVCGILSFLPNIAILFFLLEILEDSGYMPRAAYVMDGIMSKIGLSGNAFIPLILGFGCSVPAIMASRTLKDRKDRLKTILITPFMSCSARLPVYIFLSDMFFGKYALFAAYSMYAAGMLFAVLTAHFMSVSGKNGQTNALIMELPDYKMPDIGVIMIYVWEKIKDYLERAGTVILASSVILWFLMNFGKGGLTYDIGESFGAGIGRILVPVMRPAGLGDWRIILSLIAGISAKEVVVSSMRVLYGADSLSDFAAVLAGSGFSAVNAYSMMLFCLLYIPCIAAIAAVRRETESVKFTIFAALFQLAAAWTVSAVFFQTAEMVLRYLM